MFRGVALESKLDIIADRCTIKFDTRVFQFCWMSSHAEILVSQKAASRLLLFNFYTDSQLVDYLKIHS